MAFTRAISGGRFPGMALLPVLSLAGMITVASSARGEPETNTNAAAPPLPGASQETNATAAIAQETMRSFLILQEQLHATRLAMERDRQEAAAAAQRNSEAVAARLEAIESALAQQRSNELEAFRASNKTMLTVASIFGAVGLVGLLFIAYSHWRSIHRLADLAASIPTSFGMRPGLAIAGIEAGATKLLPMGASEQSGHRLLDALEKLEKRILEMEQSGRSAGTEISSVAGSGSSTSKNTVTSTSTITGVSVGAGSGAAAGASSSEVEPATNGGPHSGHSAEETAELLKQGQALLDQDQAEQALATFEQAVTREPGNAEALVKKGAALERLRKSDEALKCYDQAIAANKSLTIAYLYKGGLFNRMERFNEALQCYELALRTQEGKKEE